MRQSFASGRGVSVGRHGYRRPANQHVVVPQRLGRQISAPRWKRGQPLKRLRAIFD